MAWRCRLSLSLSAPTLADELVRKYASAGVAALGGLAIGPASRPHCIRGKADTKLNTSMRGDIEALGGGRQMELPLSLQVAFGVRPECPRGDAPAVVCNAIDPHHSCHDFPASLLGL